MVNRMTQEERHVFGRQIGAPPWPRGRSVSIACNWASGFKGEKGVSTRVQVHGVFRDFGTPVFLFARQPKAHRDLMPHGSARRPAARWQCRRRQLSEGDPWRSALTAGERRGPGVAGRAGAQAELVRAAESNDAAIGGPAARNSSYRHGAVASSAARRAQRQFFHDLRRVQVVDQRDKFGGSSSGI